MKKAVVTGGAGFIGSHLLEELAQRDYSLLVIDDFSTGKQENITSVLKKPNVTIANGSIIDLPFLQKSFKDADYVFHLAAVASVPRSIDDPRLCHDINITGTLNVLIAARDNKVKKVINTSSCSVYGDAPGLPKKEDMLKNPVSPYAVSKLAGEYYCQVFQNVYQLPTVSLRLFNVFGPRQDADSDYANAIPRFIKLKLLGKNINIYGNGQVTRDYIYVKDVVAAFILAAESEASGIYNIGSGKAVTINQLAELISQLTGNNTPPIYLPPRPGDALRCHADISKAKKAFDFRPRYSLKAGIQETIRYMKS